MQAAGLAWLAQPTVCALGVPYNKMKLGKLGLCKQSAGNHVKLSARADRCLTAVLGGLLVACCPRSDEPPTLSYLFDEKLWRIDVKLNLCPEVVRDETMARLEEVARWLYALACGMTSTDQDPLHESAQYVSQLRSAVESETVLMRSLAGLLGNANDTDESGTVIWHAAALLAGAKHP
eukprot:COSAG01_NODE_10008_length_2276_cov_2.978870_1_plen_178_part_00